MSSQLKSGSNVNETVASTRLHQIQSQLSKTHRSEKLISKVGIITGVGSLKGIGRAASFQFAHEGAKALYLLDFDGTHLPGLKEALTKSYPDVKVTTVQGDAADDETISGLCERAMREEGKLDFFYANAGIASFKHLSRITAEEFMKMIRVNTLSCFLAIKYSSAAMLKPNPSRGKEASWGSIILTSSVSGLRAMSPADYSASMAAVNSLAKTSAYQLQGKNIRVNSICPGVIETEMTNPSMKENSVPWPRMVKEAKQVVPLARHGVPEEIARFAVFLASDDSSYVNGQNMAIDGGLSACHPNRISTRHPF